MSITINGATNTISSTGTVTLPTVAGVTSLGNTALGDAEASDTHAIKGATTLLANSASAALTVTQTGAGNAFVVEDSASTDTTPFVIDASGNTTIGAVSGYATVKLTVVGSSSDASIQQVRNSVDTAGFDLKFVKNRAALYSSGIVVSGDQLGSLIFSGNDGTNAINAARITAEVDGTPGASDMPGRLVFSTTADGASSPTERMRIDSAGLITARNSTGLGYGAGSGGTVTQATSKATAVTLNKPSGQITMDAAALAAGASVTFIVNNSTVTYADITTVNLVGGVSSSENYRIENENTNTGLFRVRVTNLSAGSLSESAVLNFCVIKGSQS